MEGKAKYIFPAFLSGGMAFMMTAVITAINVGVPPDFVRRWLTAFIIAWPLAYLAALLAAPLARRATAAVVARLEGKRS